jgi:Tfp pilus assembly protein PilO
MAYNYKTEFQRYRRYYQAIEPVLNKPKSRAYTTIIFSFLAVSLFGWYAIRPTIQTILFLQREIRDKTEVNKKMEDKIAALIEAQAYYQEVEPILPVVDQALPTIPDAVPLMIQLRNLASTSGTLITAVQLPAVPLTSQELNVPASKGQIKSPTNAASGKQQTYDLSLAVRGSYPAIRAFLEGAMQMRRIISIDSFTIIPMRAESVSSESAVPTNRLLQLALKFKAYYLVD